MPVTIPRVLEPEYMDDPQEARQYDDLDHTEVNTRFVDDLIVGGPVGPDVLDLGTGTARIPVLLCKRLEEVRVMAADAAISMLEVARYHIEIEGVRERVQLIHLDAKDSQRFAQLQFDTILSNSLFHHLPEPVVALRNALKWVRPGGRLFIRDLLRPTSVEEVERLVALHAQGASLEGQQLLRQSLHAALSLEECFQMMDSVGLPRSAITPTSDRHWTMDVTATDACKPT